MKPPEISEMKSLFIIDDDVDFTSALQNYFKLRGLEIVTLSETNTIDRIDFSRACVIILDLLMPNTSGFELLRKIRETTDALIIILTNMTDVDTKYETLGNGADFFLAKPTELRELYLICKSALNREALEFSSHNFWLLYRSGLKLVAPNHRTVKLTVGEFKVIEKIMMSHPDSVSKNDIFRAFGDNLDENYKPTSYSIEVLISRVRKKCRNLGCELPVQSLRNFGYIFSDRCRVE